MRTRRPSLRAWMRPRPTPPRPVGCAWRFSAGAWLRGPGPGAWPLSGPHGVHCTERAARSASGARVPRQRPRARRSVNERPGQLRGPDRLGVGAGAERRIGDAGPALHPRHTRLEADDVLVVELRCETDRNVRAAGRGGVVLGAGAIELAEVVATAEADIGAHVGARLEDALELAGERHRDVDLVGEVADDVVVDAGGERVLLREHARVRDAVADEAVAAQLAGAVGVTEAQPEPVGALGVDAVHLAALLERRGRHGRRSRGFGRLGLGGLGSARGLAR